jgi:L-lactate dehydrogenase complex protein LldF
MPLKRHDFRAASANAVADETLGAAIRKTANLLLDRRTLGVADYPGFEALRDWGRARKLEVSGRLQAFVQEFKEQLEARGGVVHFARNAQDVAGVVIRIARERGARTAVKSKSMTAEEVGLNEVLAEAGVDVTETDLGEFIIQLAGEKPSHILAPAIHRNRAQVGELFHDLLGSPPGLDVEDLVVVARNALRQRFLAADLGITGGNFAIAETGTLVLVTNEGNGRLTTTLPPVQVAIVGMDKIIPKLADLPGFLTLLIRSATGQVLSSYVTVITGPRRPGEEEGPQELHVIFLDNGRSALATGPFREMLHCLHCGACLNHCPVYQTVGGHAYESVYPGPMGDVISPLLWGMGAYPDLPDACTLCGRCAEVCPVQIPLPDYHRMLRALREREKWLTKGADLLAAATACPAMYGRGVGFLNRILAGKGGGLSEAAAGRILAGWDVCRERPRPQDGESFRAWWSERRRGGR